MNAQSVPLEPGQIVLTVHRKPLELKNLDNHLIKLALQPGETADMVEREPRPDHPWLVLKMKPQFGLPQSLLKAMAARGEIDVESIQNYFQTK